MRQLLFEIKNQHIVRKDTFRPVAYSRNYLYAHFDFLTEEWKNKIITAVFRKDEVAYEVIIDADNDALVPWELLQGTGDIQVSCFAGNLITVNKSRVHIYESGYGEDLESNQDPTPSVYQQLVERIEYISHNIDGGLFTDWEE